MLKDGITLIHEHTTIDLSKIKNEPDCFLDCKEETIKEYQELYASGVRNIIDVTAIGMGRNIEYTNEVAEKSGINIIQATGFYKEPFLPDYVYEYTIEQLADLMVSEIENGMENGVYQKAGILGEIGTSLNKMTEMERKVFEASVLAYHKTNIILSTHTTLGTYALEQAAFFLEKGVNPKHVIIGHQDLCQDLNQIKTLIKQGFNVAFDTIGKNNYFPDSTKAQWLKELQDENLLDQVCLSLDITRKSNFKYRGGIGYNYLFEVFIPMCKEIGVTQESFDKMLIENPKRIFGSRV